MTFACVCVVPFWFLRGLAFLICGFGVLARVVDCEVVFVVFCISALAACESVIARRIVEMCIFWWCGVVMCVA